MRHYIQSVHMKLSYFTIQLQFSTHITHYSHNNQKDLKLNLNRVVGEQLIRIGYSLKIRTELIGNSGGIADGKVHRVPR
jgi:hypothetical protein